MLWDYVYPVLMVLIIAYIFYAILDPLVCRIERLIGMRILAILIILASIITPIFIRIDRLTWCVKKGGNQKVFDTVKCAQVAYLHPKKSFVVIVDLNVNV